VKKVTLGLDVDREIKFTINSLAELEERFGNTGLQQLFAAQNLNLTLIRALLYIGLKHGGMKFRGSAKENEILVGDLVQEHWIDKGRNLVELTKIVSEAFAASNVFSNMETDENPPKGAGG